MRGNTLTIKCNITSQGAAILGGWLSLSHVDIPDQPLYLWQFSDSCIAGSLLPIGLELGRLNHFFLTTAYNDDTALPVFQP